MKQWYFAALLFLVIQSKKFSIRLLREISCNNNKLIFMKESRGAADMKYDQLYFKIIRQVLILVSLFLFLRELERYDSFIGTQPLWRVKENEIQYFCSFDMPYHLLFYTGLHDEKSALSNISVYIRRRVIRRYRRSRSPNVSTWKHSFPDYNRTLKELTDSNPEWFLDIFLSGMWVIAYFGMSWMNFLLIPHQFLHTFFILRRYRFYPIQSLPILSDRIFYIF